MASNYYVRHCIACRTPLGERRRKVTLLYEDSFNERHPSWLKWRSEGSYYLCDTCMGKVREVLGVREVVG